MPFDTALRYNSAPKYTMACLHADLYFVVTDCYLRVLDLLKLLNTYSVECLFWRTVTDNWTEV